MVTVANHMVSNMEENIVSGSSLSAKNTRPEKKNPTTNQSWTIRKMSALALQSVRATSCSPSE